MKNIKGIKKQLRKNLFKTYQGWWQWHKIVRRRKIEPQTVILLLPTCGTSENYYAMLYLDKFLESQSFNRAIILTRDTGVVKAAHLFSNNIAEIIEVSEKKIDALLQFACLYYFDERLFIASLNKPDGRYADRLIGVNGISYGEVFSLGVYKLSSYYDLRPPKYKGHDKEIKEFFRRGERII